MKTAISIPDSIFKPAEELAHRMGVSRSELYVKALSKLLKEERTTDITKRLNQVYGENENTLDPVLEKLQFASLPKGEW